jgi:hypothetical protein
MSTSTLSRANGKGKTKAGPPPSSLINFSLSGEGEAAARHKRAKFNAERRLQVKSVRKRGACMRCRLLKIPVSDSNNLDWSFVDLVIASVLTINVAWPV